jgi:hypothetical protein
MSITFLVLTSLRVISDFMGNGGRQITDSRGSAAGALENRDQDLAGGLEPIGVQCIPESAIINSNVK